MSIEHVSRSGKVYYLHGKPGKGGKLNLFFSTDAADGSLVDAVPNGFEIYENVAGKVFLWRIPKKLIADEELQLVQTALATHAEEWRYKTEVKKNIITVHETESHNDRTGVFAPWIDPAKEKQFRIRHAYYMVVLRFILTDPAQRGKFIDFSMTEDTYQFVENIYGSTSFEYPYFTLPIRAQFRASAFHSCAPTGKWAVDKMVTELNDRIIRSETWSTEIRTAHACDRSKFYFNSRKMCSPSTGRGN